MLCTGSPAVVFSVFHPVIRVQAQYPMYISWACVISMESYRFSKVYKGFAPHLTLYGPCSVRLVI